MSAHTMRLLVKLAKLKHEEASVPNKAKKKQLRRGNTLTSARSKQQQTPEEITARRISHYANKNNQDAPARINTMSSTLHPNDTNQPKTRVRSYSDPKDTVDDNASNASDSAPQSEHSNTMEHNVEKNIIEVVDIPETEDSNNLSEVHVTSLGSAASTDSQFSGIMSSNNRENNNNLKGLRQPTFSNADSTDMDDEPPVIYGGAPSVFVDSEDDASTGGGYILSTRLGALARPQLDKVDENEQLDQAPVVSDEADLLQAYESNNSANSGKGSLWSCLCCCASKNKNEATIQLTAAEIDKRVSVGSAYGGALVHSESLRSGTSTTIQKLADPAPLSIQFSDSNQFDHGYASSQQSSDSIIRTLHMDQLYGKRTSQLLTRPPRFVIENNKTNPDQTMEPRDVKLWDEPFGMGASGRVFKAVYLPTCQVLAVKVVNRLDNENVRQVLGEFRDQQELLPDCEQLMRILGWYRDLEKNTVVIALEYMDMGSIYDSCFPKDNTESVMVNTTAEEQEKSGHKQIKVEKLTYDQLRFIARESLIGLDALHSCNPALVHRDIKPQNILASSFGQVKVADFGLLKRVDETGRLHDSKGTEKYFSPERINKSYGVASDIWSLGITMIEIYNQRLISSDELDWFKVVEQGIDIDEFIPSDAPDDFTKFVKKCLTKDESKRPSAKELLHSDAFVTRGYSIISSPSSHSHSSSSHNSHSSDSGYVNSIIDTGRGKYAKKTVRFSDVRADQKSLDKLIGWLELWILEDEDMNGRILSEGDVTHLKQCVYNLARFTGYSPDYVDRYIAEVYREHLNKRATNHRKITASKSAHKNHLLNRQLQKNKNEQNAQYSYDITLAVVPDERNVEQQHVMANPLVAILGIGEYDGLDDLEGVENDYRAIVNTFYTKLKYSVTFLDKSDKMRYFDSNQNKLSPDSALSFKLKWNGKHIDKFLSQVEEILEEGTKNNVHDGLIFVISGRGDGETVLLDSENLESSLLSICGQFFRSKSLVNKPKIFVVDTSRGTNKSSGAGTGLTLKQNLESYRNGDCWFLYSVDNGANAANAQVDELNNDKGGWLIQSAASVFASGDVVGNGTELNEIIQHIRNETNGLIAMEVVAMGNGKTEVYFEPNE